MLKPQDIYVLLRIVAQPEQQLSQAFLAKELAMSSSQIHASLQRCVESQLFNKRKNVVNIAALTEFLMHGIRYSFPAQRGPLTRGFPTSYAAPPLVHQLIDGQLDYPPVWPDPIGPERGYELVPLYSSAASSVKGAPRFYEILALVDAIREGRSRERKLAIAALNERLLDYQEKHQPIYLTS